MKIYITKYALTRGIQCLSNFIFLEHIPGAIEKINPHYNPCCYHTGKILYEGEWHKTLIEAQKCAKTMRLKEIKKLRKKIKKLTKMKFKKYTDY